MVQERRRVARRTDDDHAEVVQEPAESLGQQLVLVRDDDPHAMLLLRD
jgi:hypothetical protein